MELKATIRANTTFTLSKEFDKLAKRATRLGVAAPVLVIGERYSKEVPVYASAEARANGVSDGSLIVEVCDVVITGEAPKLQGWSFVARLERLEGTTENLLSGVPGVVLPEQYRHTDANLCEHCNTRRVRKATYVMHNEAEGRYMQVGHNCLADFTGTNSPDKLLKGWMTNLEGLRELIGDSEGDGISYGMRSADMHEVEEVLAWAVAIVEWQGGYKFKPKDDLYGLGTGDEVFRHMFGRFSKDEPRCPHPTEAHAARAREIHEFLRNVNPTSDYERNLKIMASATVVGPRQVRMVASGIYGWMKARSAALIRPTLNEFFGVEKQRLRDLKLEVVRTIAIDSDFGSCQIVLMKDEQGRTFKWSNTSSHRMREATRVLVTGTVKGHEEYKGTKQTKLTRCVWEQVDGDLTQQHGMVGVRTEALAAC